MSICLNAHAPHYFFLIILNQQQFWAHIMKWKINRDWNVPTTPPATRNISSKTDYYTNWTTLVQADHITTEDLSIRPRQGFRASPSTSTQPLHLILLPILFSINKIRDIFPSGINALSAKIQINQALEADAANNSIMFIILTYPIDASGQPWNLYSHYQPSWY